MLNVLSVVTFSYDVESFMLSRMFCMIVVKLYRMLLLLRTFVTYCIYR